MQQAKEKVALGSIAASGGLTVAKAIVGVMTGSLAILSEAAHSLIDFAATVMTYIAVRMSGKPADEEHHYGHGKFESLAALLETALLFVLSGVVIYEGIKRLLGDEHAVEATLPAFAVIGASIVIDFFRARILNKVAHETSSQALEADALHFSSDLWSSLAVLIGLAGVAFGLKWADAAAALVVADPRAVCRLASRPPHHRHPARHRASGRRGPGDPDRAARAGRGRDRRRARAAGRPGPVRRAQRLGQPHHADRPRRGAEARRHQGRSRRIAECADQRGHRTPRARQRDDPRPRDGHRAQSGPRGAPCHRACHRRKTFGLARSRGGRLPHPCRRP